MAKKILGVFDRRPLIWFHYVLLVGVLWFAYYAGVGLLGDKFQNIIVMLIWFFIWIGIGDQLIHYLLGVD